MKFVAALGIGFLSAAFLSSAHAANCTSANSIISVTNYKLGAFEYVRFKVKKPFSANFTTTNVLPPFTQDGSGDVVPVAGGKWTQVQFQNVEWMCTIAHSFHLPKPIVKDVKSLGQFEGVIAYVIGRRATSHYISTTTISAGSYNFIRVKFSP
jgi:hypothetical protein